MQARAGPRAQTENFLPVSAAVLIKRLPFVRLKARTEQKMGVYGPFLGRFCQSRLSVHSRLGFVKSHVRDHLQSVSCSQ